ncbi:MAG TPA: transketolase [Methanocorpusculum sp.]|nr:transketolase [Methanocorpusculum sp.]
MSSYNSLIDLSNNIRGEIIKTAHNTESIHVGGCLSCIDILVSLYYCVLSIKPDEPDYDKRDFFILSKGHAVLAWYLVLAHRGYFPVEEAEAFNTHKSLLTEHPIRGNIPGVEVSTGSLGHGLSIGNGLALGAKLSNNPSRTFVLMSDGECDEGEVWEAASFASMHNLNNLVVIVDFNGLQACGFTSDIMNLRSLKDKFESFGWDAFDADGHDIAQMIELINSKLETASKPIAVIAHTVKGKGVSFMENDNNWHYRVPSEEEMHNALKELRLE